ncbi:PAS domain-containing protein, partial [Guyparkeria sp. 1SP6A2]|nr:PAS domain-containing protein [Guyparkeria sp. 1SP6A2]
MSQGATALTGYHPDELVKSRVISFGELVHPEDFPRLSAAAQRAVEERCPFRVIYRLRHRDGCERWVWEQGQAIYTQSGE